MHKSCESPIALEDPKLWEEIQALGAAIFHDTLESPAWQEKSVQQALTEYQKHQQFLLQANIQGDPTRRLQALQCKCRLLLEEQLLKDEDYGRSMDGHVETLFTVCEQSNMQRKRSSSEYGILNKSMNNHQLFGSTKMKE
jgi:hypothetical protein